MSTELQTYENARELLRGRLKQTGKAHELVEGIGQDRETRLLVCTEEFATSGGKIDYPVRDHDGQDVWVIVGESGTNLEQMFHLDRGLSFKVRECFIFGRIGLSVIKGGEIKLSTDLAGDISIEPPSIHPSMLFSDLRYKYSLNPENSVTTARIVLAALGQEIN
ncbi:hypothetical protein HYW43_03495 [Candidatus Daviesbacteria bacterium]|nr:hypothetical protein [Candidatus Daviesbacteria bacterium]MBI2599958.1 hypothetical protein [Candidatus Daviesbacteria bacterium]